jgi:acyl dehydratase
MPLDPSYVGRTYGPFTYQLGLEKMREFAVAVAGGVPSSVFRDEPPAGLSPLLFDEVAARKGPYRAVIAFPTFAAAFAMRPFSAAVRDPALGIDLSLLVHGEQELEFGAPMRAGDLLTTRGEIVRIFEKASLDFLVVRTESTNQDGAVAVRGVWTAVIRRQAA